MSSDILAVSVLLVAHKTAIYLSKARKTCSIHELIDVIYQEHTSWQLDFNLETTTITKQRQLDGLLAITSNSSLAQLILKLSCPII